MTNDNKQLSKSWMYIARYALPTGALMFAAIMVGVFTPVWGKTAGFAIAGGIWVIGSVVGVSRFRAWHRKLTAITLLMLGAHMSLAAGATAAMSVPVPVPDESPPVMAVCIDAAGTVQRQKLGLRGGCGKLRGRFQASGSVGRNPKTQRGFGRVAGDNAQGRQRRSHPARRLTRSPRAPRKGPAPQFPRGPGLFFLPSRASNPKITPWWASDWSRSANGRVAEVRSLLRD